MTDLAAPMTGDGVRAEPMTEAHREPLRSACTEDREIWTIFALSFDRQHFDATFDTIMALPWVRFTLFDNAGELIGMSSFLNIMAENPAISTDECNRSSVQEQEAMTPTMNLNELGTR